MALTTGEDKEKALEILRKADERLQSIMESIGKVNASLTNFSERFNTSAKSVGLLNDELRTLQRITGNKFKINIPVVTTSTSSNGGGKGGNSGASSSSSGVLKADSKEILEIERKLKEIENNLKKSQLSLNEQKKLIDYNRKRLYDEYSAKQAKKFASEAEEKKWSKAAADQEYKESLYDSKVKKAQTAYEASKRNEYTSWWESELNKKDAADAAGYAEYKSRMEKEEAASEALAIRAKRESQDQYENGIKGMFDYMSDKLLGNSPLGKAFKQISNKLLVKGGLKEGETVTSAIKEILNDNPILIQITAITGVVKMLNTTVEAMKVNLEKLTEYRKQAVSTVTDYSNAANLLGSNIAGSLTELVRRDAIANTENLLKEMNQANALGAASEVYGGGLLDRIGTYTSNWLLGTAGYKATEPAEIREKFVSDAMLPLISEGTKPDKAEGLARAMYEWGAQIAPNFLTTGEDGKVRTELPSETAQAILEAILGNDSAIQKYGFMLNDKMLEGFMNTFYNTDMVNVEYSESFKQGARMLYLQEQINRYQTEGIQNLKNFNAALERVGESMEHFKNQLFSFDEVISLDAYDDTHIGSYSPEELMGLGINPNFYYDYVPSDTPDDYDPSLYTDPSLTGTATREYGWAYDIGTRSHKLIDVTGSTNYIGQRMTLTAAEAAKYGYTDPYVGKATEPIYQTVYNTPFGQTDASTVEGIGALGGTALGSVIGGLLLGPAGILIGGLLGNLAGSAGAEAALNNTPSLSASPHTGQPWNNTNYSSNPPRVFANGGIGTKQINGASLFEGDKAEAVIPLESQAGIDFLGSAMKQAMGGEEGFGGDQIIVNLNLSGLNVADDDSRWEQIGTKIAEVIDVQRQRRGELNYGAAY